MKKITLLLISILMFSGVVFAGDFLYEPPFEWKSPEIMSQGSSFTANATGYDALFTNPAALRSEKGDFNLITVQPTWTANPFTLLESMGIDPEADMEGSGEEEAEIDYVGAILDQVTSNGLGAGVQTSLGWAGKGLGLATAVSVDSDFPYAESIGGASGQVWATAAFIGGYAVQFDFLGINFKVGADLRPMFRVKLAEIDLTTAQSLIPSGDSEGEEDTDLDLSGIPVYSGTALGIDAGVLAKLGWFTLGMSLRDIGNTTFTYSESNLQSLIDNQSIVNETDYSGAVYKTPASLRLGASFHPELGRFLTFLVDPVVHAEYTTYLVGEDYYEEGEFDPGTTWSRLDVGGQVTLLKMVDLRAGYNGGYLAAGVGIDLLFLEVNLGIWSYEGGDYAGDQQAMAGSLDVSVRF